jgi:hypothetical protein
VIRFSTTIDIARPAAAVYAYLANLEHTPEWNWAIASSRRVTPGPVAIGSRFELTRAAPHQAVEVLEVTRLDPDRRIEVVGDLASFPVHLTYELAPSPHGTTVSNSVEMEPRGPLRHVGTLLTGRVRASVSENLRVLRDLLEARRGGE